MSKPTITGYLVIEHCEDCEQILRLRFGDGLPALGLLDWPDKSPVTLFPSKLLARQAIERTEHYRLAFADSQIPEKRFCKVRAAAMLEEPAQEAR